MDVVETETVFWQFLQHSLVLRNAISQLSSAYVVTKGSKTLTARCWWSTSWWDSSHPRRLQHVSSTSWPLDDWPLPTCWRLTTHSSCFSQNHHHRAASFHDLITCLCSLKARPVLVGSTSYWTLPLMRSWQVLALCCRCNLTSLTLELWLQDRNNL